MPADRAPCGPGRPYPAARRTARVATRRCSTSPPPASRDAVATWIAEAKLRDADWLFSGGKDRRKHLTTRRYARLVDGWIVGIGLDPATCGTPSPRRTKAAIVDCKTGNLRAVQLLSRPSEIESGVCYFGVEVDDALEIAEHVDL
mgnify:FL=1